MRLFIQSSRGERQEINSFPKLSKLSAACAWVGGYIQIHALNTPITVEVAEIGDEIHFREGSRPFKLVLVKCER